MSADVHTQWQTEAVSLFGYYAETTRHVRGLCSLLNSGKPGKGLDVLLARLELDTLQKVHGDRQTEFLRHVVKQARAELAAVPA